MLVNTYAFDSAVMMQHGYQDMLASMVFLLFWSLVRFNCAPVRRVEHFSCPEGCDLKLESLSA